MAVWALGINHHTAPLDLRGRLAFATDQVPQALQALRLQTPSPEVALLSTCNRTEVYCVADESPVSDTLQWLCRHAQLPPQALQPHTYILQDDQAARHAFRVASGLDSMVLGEAQILGQLKDAVREAERGGALGRTLHQMFQRSFAVAKQVRSSTAIGMHSISMAAAAVRLAGQLFEDLRAIRILFVGAGDMIELAITHFAAKSPQHMVVANRTLERGEALASRFGAHTMALSELPQRLHEFDAVISCTASSLPIIGLGAVEQALKRRKHRPMFMVDLAVPRDIEAQVKELDDVYLYTVDDLAHVVQTGLDQRQAAVAEAEAIIETGVRSFMDWLDQREPNSASAVVPLIQQLNQQADEWRQLELAKAHKRLAKGEPPEAVLDAFSKAIAQKFLHGAMVELHTTPTDERDAMVQAIERLFLRGTDARTTRHRS